jgi:hypothetical protein
MLQPGPIVGGHPDVGMQIESVQVGLAWPSGAAGRLGRLPAQAADPGARVPAERHPPLHRGAHDLRQNRRDLGEPVGSLGLGPRRPTSAREPPPHPVADGAEDGGDGLIAGRRRRVELEPAGHTLGEHAIQDQRMEVDVEIHPASEALDDRQHPGPAPAEAEPVSTANVEILEHPCVDAQHGAGQPMVPCEPIPQPLGHLETGAVTGSVRAHSPAHCVTTRPTGVRWRNRGRRRLS